MAYPVRVRQVSYVNAAIGSGISQDWFVLVDASLPYTAADSIAAATAKQTALAWLTAPGALTLSLSTQFIANGGHVLDPTSPEPIEKYGNSFPATAPTRWLLVYVEFRMVASTTGSPPVTGRAVLLIDWNGAAGSIDSQARATLTLWYNVSSFLVYSIDAIFLLDQHDD